MEHVDRIIEAIRTKARTIPQFFEYDDAPLNEMEWLRYACIPIRDSFFRNIDQRLLQIFGRTVRKDLFQDRKSSGHHRRRLGSPGFGIVIDIPKVF